MRALLLMGPTASGKSALALDLAGRIGGEIVNVDSMQVYGDFRVLTARPSPAEEATARHHLYGHIDARELYSVGRWLGDARAAIAAIGGRGAIPILVGGTGLYFKALTEGLADMPCIDADLRLHLRARAKQEGAPALLAELARVDAETAARLEPNDGPRILRALEVWQTGGVSITALQAKALPALRRGEWVGAALTPNRAGLYQSINQRFAKMLEQGAVEEVRGFAARELDPALPAMKAHGAPALMAHLRGELSLEEAAEIASRDTRRYAKRQFTWIANQMKDWIRIEPPELSARTAAVLDLLGAKRGG